MNASQLCQTYGAELVTPAEFAERYGISLDCSGMCCDRTITVADPDNLAIVCHELAHVLYPAINDHNVIIWLGILILVSLRKDLS